MRSVVAVTLVVLGPGAFAPALANPAPTRQVSEAQRKACRDDAFRLCPGQVALMRREAVRACLKSRPEQLSPLCRSAFSELRKDGEGGQP